MKQNYILAIDQGTSGTKAIIFNRGGALIGRHNESHGQFYPQPGWVEHDAQEIYENTLLAIKGVLDETGIKACEIAALAISNQRETAVVWDITTGAPVYNAVVWQCSRGMEICRKLEAQGIGDAVLEKTGLVLSPYFSAAKIKWILDHVPGAREKAESGVLACGTMDSWLIFKLTGGRVHATDYSNASRTQLFNINTLVWDDDLLHDFTIPREMMPEVLSSNAIFGTTTAGGIFEDGVRITGVMGDSHAALFGQSCFEKGMTKVTYGSGSSIMMNIGTSCLRSKKGVVTSLAWGMDGQVEYVFEGNINFTGATIKWLEDDLELIPTSSEAGPLAVSVPDNGGVYLVPAFTGLGAPYWDSNARALITGITRGTKRAHLVRAAEESIAYQIKDVIDIMVNEAGASLRELRVDGGPTRDDFLMQFQADILPARVVRNRIEEISAAGVALMAGLTVGFWVNKVELCALRSEERSFESKMDSMMRNSCYKGWKTAVRQARFRG